MGQSRPLFVYFRYFLDTISIIQIEKSVDGVLGIQTRGRRMVGADETTELWRPPTNLTVCFAIERILQAIQNSAHSSKLGYSILHENFVGIGRKDLADLNPYKCFIKSMQTPLSRVCIQLLISFSLLAMAGSELRIHGV